MQDWLAARARISPEQLAVLDETHAGENRAWTYRALDGLAARLCAWLAGHGVECGGRIAARLPNDIRYVALIHAAARLGAALAPLNLRLTAGEINGQVVQADPALVVCADDAAASGLDAPCALLPPVGALLEDHRLAGTAADYTARAVALDDVYAIVFTSGTTGQPKGAMLTYSNFFYSANASAYRLGLLPDDLWLCALPLYHVGGLSIVLRSCLYGTGIVLHDRFDPATVITALAAQPVTLVSLVPTMLHRLLEADPTARWKARLRLVLLGGAAASPALLERCRGAALPVATTYGLTEAASQVATATPAAAQAKPGTVGKPLLFTVVRVVDGQGRDVPAGEVGEIVVSGPTVMAGYFRDGAATAQTMRDGALYTGDLGYVDSEGDLWIVQRRADLIVSGGENVYPAEVETVLAAHPAVDAACVVGLPDSEWGQQVAAAIVLRPEARVTADELTAFARGYLAGYKLPRALRFVERLPLTASGKVSRQEVLRWFDAQIDG